MWLLVGLGNPGREYEGNRHNIGFMAIDALADQHGFGGYRAKFQGLLSEGAIGDHKVVLLKPQTFMNESGQSVGKAAKFYKIAPSRIVVFHDELGLDASKCRIKIGGGTAGHNGLKSIKAHLGTADFKRVRMGIGHPGDRARVSGYVLSDFVKAEQGWLEAMLDGMAEHAPLLLDESDDFMTKVAETIKKV